MTPNALLLSLVFLVACVAERRSFAHPNSDVPLSSAVLVGDTLYVSGHLGRDSETGLPPSDPAREVELLLDAFAATLQRAEMAMEDLVSVQVFCSDVSLYSVFNAAYRERFDGEFPARAFIGSGALLRGCRFEMTGIARR